MLIHGKHLLMSALFGLPSAAAIATEGFPAHPLQGEFELVSSNPEIDSVDPKDLSSEVLQTGQRIRLAFRGEYGADWPGREVYAVTLFPPFAASFCKRSNWDNYCTHGGSRAPEQALELEAYVDAERMETDEIPGIRKAFVPFGLAAGKWVYQLTYSDATASHLFYLQDWTTLISRSNYKDASGKRVVVIQTLKRRKTP